jgi:hypothetical protein
MLILMFGWLGVALLVFVLGVDNNEPDGDFCVFIILFTNFYSLTEFYSYSLTNLMFKVMFDAGRSQAFIVHCGDKTKSATEFEFLS